MKFVEFRDTDIISRLFANDDDDDISSFARDTSRSRRDPETGTSDTRTRNGSGELPVGRGAILRAGPPFREADAPAVRAMQRVLIALGYSVGSKGADGQYGPDTAGALLAFKRDHRLPGSGNSFSARDQEAMLRLIRNNDGAIPEPSSSSGTSGSTAGEAEPTDDTITMIKKFEGFRARAYWDVRQWSIGYGSRAEGPNQTITEPEAEELLKQRIRHYERDVERWNEAGDYNWNEGQKGALISFAYNIGSIRQLTDRGRRDNATIARKMLEYVRAGGRREPGLVTRREIERAKFVMHTPELSRR